MMLGTEYRSFDWKSTIGLDGIVSDAGAIALAHLISDSAWDEFNAFSETGWRGESMIRNIDLWIEDPQGSNLMGPKGWIAQMKQTYGYDGFEILREFKKYIQAHPEKPTDASRWSAAHAELRAAVQ